MGWGLVTSSTIDDKLSLVWKMGYIYRVISISFKPLKRQENSAGHYRERRPELSLLLGFGSMKSNVCFIVHLAGVLSLLLLMSISVASRACSSSAMEDTAALASSTLLIFLSETPSRLKRVKTEDIIVRQYPNWPFWRCGGNHVMENSTCECGCRRRGVLGADTFTRFDFGPQIIVMMNGKTESRSSGSSLMVDGLVRVRLRTGELFIALQNITDR